MHMEVEGVRDDRTSPVVAGTVRARMLNGAAVFDSGQLGFQKKTIDGEKSTRGRAKKTRKFDTAMRKHRNLGGKICWR